MKRLLTLILLLICVLFGTFYYYLNSESRSAHIAIKKYVFRDGNPFEASNLIIKPTDLIDKAYGKLFIVEGFVDNETGMRPRCFYLKKNANGWYVETAGTGP